MSGFLYWPLLANAIFLPSGEKSGSSSYLFGVLVRLCRPEPSGLTVQMSGPSTKAILVPSGDQVGAPSWFKSSVSFFCSEPSAFITQMSTCVSLWPSGVETRSCLTKAILVPSGDQVGPYSGRLLLSVRAFLEVPERFIT